MRLKTSTGSMFLTLAGAVNPDTRRWNPCLSLSIGTGHFRLWTPSTLAAWLPVVRNHYVALGNGGIAEYGDFTEKGLIGLV